MTGWAILLLVWRRVPRLRRPARSLLSLAPVSDFMRSHRLVFVVLLLIFLCFSGKQTGDQPKGPVAAANVDLIPLETPRQEVEKSVEGSTAMA